jgi:hypothetical protein
MTGAAAAFVIGGSGSFSVTITPSSVSAYANSGAAANLTTGNAVAAASGGVAPYTYAWTQILAGANTWTINSPAASTTTFTCQTLPAGSFDEAGFRVTATDATGATAHEDIFASANNGIPYDPDPGGRDRFELGDRR